MFTWRGVSRCYPEVNKRPLKKITNQWSMLFTTLGVALIFSNRYLRIATNNKAAAR
jgi:hypothetical protein